MIVLKVMYKSMEEISFVGVAHTEVRGTQLVYVGSTGYEASVNLDETLYTRVMEEDEEEVESKLKK